MNHFAGKFLFKYRYFHNNMLVLSSIGADSVGEALTKLPPNFNKMNGFKIWQLGQYDPSKDKVLLSCIGYDVQLEFGGPTGGWVITPLVLSDDFLADVKGLFEQFGPYETSL